MKSVYLDNNSTTPIFEEVVDEMSTCLRKNLTNPASQHRSGRIARSLLEDSRDQIAQLLGAAQHAPELDRLIFTSGGTESNNLAIHGLVSASNTGENPVPGNIVISAIEHPSVLEPAERLAMAGFELRRLPVSNSGHVSTDRLPEFIDDHTKLVCVMYANNELGTLQPIREIADFCRSRHIPMHCDAVQAVGKIPIDFRQLGVSTLAFSSHKFHGPRGFGGLLVRHGVSLRPLLLGGSQQLGTRPGTESVAAAVGTLRALTTLAAYQPTWWEQVQPLRDRLEKRILSATHAVVIGQEPRMPHATNLAFPGLDRQAIVMALDLAGVECSTGSACTSGSSEPSHVVLATGANEELVQGSIRLSLNAGISVADIDFASDRILSVINNLRSAL